MIRRKDITAQMVRAEQKYAAVRRCRAREGEGQNRRVGVKGRDQRRENRQQGEEKHDEGADHADGLSRRSATALTAFRIVESGLMRGTFVDRQPFLPPHLNRILGFR